MIENGFIPDKAIFLNGVNERCEGYALQDFIKSEFRDLNVDHLTFIYLNRLKKLIQSLPIFQLAQRLGNETKFRSDDSSIDCKKDTQLKTIYEKRLDYRMKICDLYNIKCFSFLQPFGHIHGNVFYTNEVDKQRAFKIYTELKKIKFLIDISKILDEKSNKISYVDGVHYSHESNKFIAKEILRKTNFLISKNV